MFQFSGFASALQILDLQSRGLPHSEIFGLTVICTSPKLIAAYHVLRRLQDPRHPPYALPYFLHSTFVEMILLLTFSYQYVKELNLFN